MTTVSHRVSVSEDVLRKAIEVDGLTYGEASKLFECSFHTIFRNCKKYSIVSSRKSERIDFNRVMLETAILVEGLTLLEAAERFGCSSYTVFRRAKEYGIKYPRGRGIQRKLRLIGKFKCPVCNQEKEFKYFGGLKETGIPQSSRCTSCARKEYNDRIDLPKKFRSILWAAKRTSDKKGRMFSITEVDLNSLWEKQKGLCYYTGIEMIPGQTGKNGNTVSIDRIDSSIGYTLGNIVLCCTAINFMKRDMSHSDFVKWCGLVSKSHVSIEAV